MIILRFNSFHNVGQLTLSLWVNLWGTLHNVPQTNFAFCQTTLIDVWPRGQHQGWPSWRPGRCRGSTWSGRRAGWRKVSLLLFALASFPEKILHWKSYSRVAKKSNLKSGPRESPQRLAINLFEFGMFHEDKHWKSELKIWQWFSKR